MTGRLYVDTTSTSHDDIDHIAIERVINRDDGPRPRLTRAEREFAARLLADCGLTVEQIAYRLHTSAATVQSLLGVEQSMRPSSESPACGSRRGYRRHQSAGEMPCAACREAARLDSAARYLARKRAARATTPAAPAA